MAPGLAVERAVASGEEHAFRIHAVAGRVIRAEAEQRGIDLEVRVEALDGRELLAVDSPTGPRGPEVLAYRPEVSGEHRLVVRAFRRGAMAGTYRLQVRETAQAEAEAEAELAVSRAASLYRQGGRERWKQAAGELRTAESARALFFLGVLHRLLDEPEPALEALERARARLQSEGEAAASWNETGYVHWAAGRADPAREAYERALAGWRVLGDRHGEAQTLNNLGLVEHSRGELRQAVERYEAAARLFQGTGDLAQAALVRNNLAGIQGQLGEPRQVLDGYREALELLRQTEERSQEPRLLLNLAAAHRALGELREALAGYRQALELFRLQGDRRGEGSALNSLGMAWLELGEPGRARSLLEEALAARRIAGDRRGEAVTLQNLGIVRDRLGEPREALELLRQAMALREELDDRLGRASTLEQMGAVHAALGEPVEALRRLEEALEVRGGEGDPLARGRALISAAEARIALGQAAPAAEALRAALELARAAGDLSGEARALVALARVERALHRPAEALARLDAAFERIEELRSRIASPELRSSYLAARRGAYELAIDVRLDLHRLDPAAGHDRAALEVSERARARSRLDLLGATGDDVPAGTDPELVRRRQLLRERAGAKEMRRLALLASDAPAERRREVEKELEAVLLELQLLEGEIGGRGAARWSAPELQVAPGTLLLEYALGEERSALWAVSASSVELFELPGRKEIEALAARVYRRWSVLGAAEDGSAGELSRMLLGPVAGRLAGQRLAVVPDGALHYLPFGALPFLGEPLLVRHEVVTLPSASFLTAQRRALASRPPAARSLAVLADPVFDPHDPRVRGGKAPAGNDTTRSGDLPLFDRLASSRREAEAIASLAEGAVLALDFQARRSLLTEGRLADFRVLHFATHGTFHGEHPELSGIVLSLVDESGRPQDGFLRLPDLHALSLAADLVVLSGCQTALGREIRGEGLVGLSQGFLDAGARNVVASLWQVPDRATAELMTAFYRSYLQRGTPPAAALREAQLAVRARRGWSEPYHWASFILMGEGR
ncbi:MAG TPA: CHAT domain-containing tetratricopeptide repeat protein [Thermoanaerobaculia bacterium]|nr:CHAT domain-containing tetratricopeptide repeat protein [Thermoanaerobaculia bacterium]